MLVVNPRIVGKRVGGAMKDILAAAKGGNWRRVDNGAVEVVNHRIEAGEYEVRFQAREGSRRGAASTATPASSCSTRT